MSLEEFKNNISQNIIPANELLKAMFFDKTGNWDAAHKTVQDINGKDAAHIHAYLHRKECDISNAGYWYLKAGVPEFTGSLNEEWDLITTKLLENIN